MTPTHHRLARAQVSTAPLLKLAASAVLAAVLATGLAQQAQAHPMGGHGMQHGMAEPGMGMGMGMGMMGMGRHGAGMSGRLLDEIGASAEQKARLQQIYEAARADLRSQQQSAPGTQQQLLQLLAAPQADPAAAEALRQQHLARQDSASKRMLQAMLEAQAVLTPEQRQKLAERLAARGKAMQQRHERHGATPRG